MKCIRLLFACVLIFNASGSWAQGFKKLEAYFIENKKDQKNVNYYYLKNDTATAIRRDGRNLLIDTNRFKKKPFRLLAVHRDKNIAFSLPFYEIYYIGVTHTKGSKEYVISLGLEDDLIVKATDRKYVIVESK